MKFVDESFIKVEAGKGGDGCLSFRREKYIEFGGPDGGNGGRGASVYLVADPHLNTLVDFRYRRLFKAPKGHSGSGKDRIGAAGKDLFIKVPIGTQVVDDETGEVIGDILKPGQELLVAKGGESGLGNAYFKSSTNRAPRQTTKGTPGDVRALRLELKILADVGLLGLPNAGKSTLIRALSAAKPKVADYPFTTLIPHLGVVSVDRAKSFVLADIPGLIEGAADGVGLGVRFLKHLARTELLWHVVDVAPWDEIPLEKQVKSIVSELEKFSPTLAQRPRWLILNKVDLVTGEQAESLKKALLTAIRWDGPVFSVSAMSGLGVKELAFDTMQFLDNRRAQLLDSDFLLSDKAAKEKTHAEIRESISAIRLARKQARERAQAGQKEQEDEVSVVYAR